MAKTAWFDLREPPRRDAIAKMGRNGPKRLVGARPARLRLLEE